MNKKIVALLLALTLCLTSVVALAAPSKTNTNTNTVTTPVEEETPIKTAAPTEETKAELAEIAAFVNQGNAVIKFFDEDVQKEIEAVLPAGVDTAALKLDEYIPLTVTGSASGSTTVTVSTAVSYSEDDAVVTMISYMVDGKKVWKVVPCTIVDGKLVISLDGELVEHIANGSAALMIVSNK